MSGADSTASFVLDGDSSGLSSAADSAAQKMERLKVQIQQESQAMRENQGAARLLTGKTADVSAQKKILQDRITASKAVVSASSAEYLKMGGNAGELTKKTKPLVEETVKVSAASKEAGNSFASWAAESSGLEEALANPYTAVAALTVGVLALGAAFFAAGLAAADFARGNRLLMQAQTGSAADASALEAHITALAQKLPIARAQIQEIEKSLAGQGLKGNYLAESLQAVAKMTAALGSGAGGKIEAIAAGAVRTRRLIIGMFDLQGTGISLDDVAKTLAKNLNTSFDDAKAALMSGRVGMDAGIKALNQTIDQKLGGTLAQMANGLSNQFEKLKEAFSAMFSNEDIDGFLEGLHSVLHLFDQTTASGKAIKQILSGIFGPMKSEAGGVFPAIRGFMLTAVLGAQELYGAYLTVAIALKKAIPPKLRPDIDMVTAGIVAAKVAGYGLLAVVLALGPAILISSLPILLIGAALVLVGYVIYKVGQGIYYLIDAIANLGNASEKANKVGSLGDAAKNAVKNAAPPGMRVGVTNAVDAVTDSMPARMGKTVPAFQNTGKNFAEGLANGIRSGKTDVANASADLAVTAIDAANKKLDTHSPSKVTYATGQNTGEGMALGIESKEDRVAGAMAGLINVPSPAAPEGGGGGKASLQIGELKVEINGVKDAASIIPSLRREIIAMLSEELMHAGAPR